MAKKSCKHENFEAELMKYCPDCGEAITICPACEATVDVDWKFCPFCGRERTS